MWNDFRHFNNAPIIEVLSRTYPAQVRYRPICDDEEQDQLQGILNAVDELQREGRGDILVFLMVNVKLEMWQKR